MKKIILLLSAVAALSSSAQAQFQCGTDEVNNRAKQLYPEIAIYEAQLKAAIDAEMKGLNWNQFAKTTDINDMTILHVPIVFHIVHDYAGDYVSDDDIYAALADINRVYSKTNPDTAQVIVPFKENIPGTAVRYIGNARIQFHLAQVDPDGKPTKGITRRRDYNTYTAGDQAKGDIWPPHSYMNIWLIKDFDANHSNAGAYAYKPGSANSYPIYHWDGIICLSRQMISDHTLSHELAHTLNIDHVWGGTNDPEQACGDDDVDDTPPTKGHRAKCGPVQLADTACSAGYEKAYDSASAKRLFNITIPSDTSYLVNYPDTNNTQNIMDYSNCSKMFTYLQTVRMRISLRSAAANRSNLIDSSNLKLTGVMDANGNIRPLADLPPIADFSTNDVGGTIREEKAFACLGQNVMFSNRSWNDTITNNQWTFTDGANNVTTATSTGVANPVSKTFNAPGWAKVELITNSNAGSDTITKDKAVYVSTGVAKSTNNYYQEFAPTDDLSEYPMFNIYENQNKWAVVNTAGYYDQSSICMNAYDKRTGNQVLYNTPIGDYDEFYTPAFDLTPFAGSGPCNLSFMLAGAATTSNPLLMLDELEISYMTNCAGSSQNWTVLRTLTKLELHNAGAVSGKEFVPASSDWVARSYNIPTNARQGKVYFRFRYKSNGDINSFGLTGTGNNVYVDRMYFNNSPTGVDDVKYQNNGFALAPNPTTGASAVIIKGTGNNASVKVQVTDVTGKLVYSTETKATNDTRVEIPSNVLTTKGIYMVTVTTDAKRQTEKLVVY